MTSPIKEYNIIKISVRDTVEHQKKIKQNRWNGYDIKIIKDAKDAMQQLQELLLRRKINRNIYLDS